MNNYVKMCNYVLSDECDKELRMLLLNSPSGKLVVPVGKIEDNKRIPIYIDLGKAHGLFVGGTTGTGKSIFIDMVIVSLMLKNKQNEIKFVFLDPKKVELGEYDGINYIINKKSISSAKKGVDILLGLLRIIHERTNILIKQRIKSIKTYNLNNKDKWPHIFVIADEASDIMNIENAEEIITQILDFGKPVGVHVILATNTYLKKYYNSRFIEHFKYRLSFDMASNEQAKYIEIEGCDLLKGSGNGLIKCNNDNNKYKFQSPFISDKAIKKAKNKLGKKVTIK